MSQPVELVSSYLRGLQARITSALTELDGTPFLSDAWQKSADEPLQGQGVTQILENGSVFERAGCGFSHVRGAKLPPSATQHRPELSGLPFEAMGVSLVFHPRNPYVPTVHMNVRMISVVNSAGATVAWFGGGMDLTPYYGFEEDAAHFHQTCRSAVAPFGDGLYPRFKAWCDTYFYLKHRQEPRGVGGIFFDDLQAPNPDAWNRHFAFVRDVGLAFLDVYPRLVRRHMNRPWTEAQRQQQLVKRGRYAEFNLLYDRGTKFGLMTGGNTEAILMSLPPLAAWP